MFSYLRNLSNVEELVAIFKFSLNKYDYTINKEAENKLVSVITEAVAKKDKNFGNARFVRNLFEKTLEKQAHRLSKESTLTKEQLSEIAIEDIPDKWRQVLLP